MQHVSQGGSIHLVSSTYKVKIMSIQELAYNISTKCEGDSTIVFTPALDVLVRIGPQQITQQTYKQHVYQLTAVFHAKLPS